MRRFLSEAGTALTFLFTFWVKPKSKIRLIRQKQHNEFRIKNSSLHKKLNWATFGQGKELCVFQKPF